MKTIILQEEEMYRLLDETHNPPLVQNQKDENAFQAEIAAEYVRLLDCLSAFGNEGDYYGISDFSIRPVLKVFPTVKPPPAAHDRRLCVFVLSKKFYRSDFLKAIRKFLMTASTDYVVNVSTDFDPEIYVMILMTADVTKILCRNPKEAARLEYLFGRL